jgi:N,N'-diacetyllegionaminate synthase
MSSERTIIIAEAGVNHNGSLKIAKQLIDAACDAGVDFVKFQTFKAETLVTRTAGKALYQKNLINAGESQFEMIRNLELNRSAHVDLIQYCKGKGIQFLSTAFDTDSIDLLEDLNIPLYKIPSGEITNLPYLRHIGSKDRPIIMSTGMANLAEIQEALNVLIDAGAKRDTITVLHCNTEYPTPVKDVNLNAMLTIGQEFNLDIGYSDHTLGIEIPIAAVAMGATIIEKHFTLDRTLPGPDHAASLEPHELSAMVKAIRKVELALGDGVKQLSPSEQKNIEFARKSIYAKKYINKGELFTAANLTTKRPGKGISPMKWDEIVGSRATRNYQPDESII